jgi:DNA-binding transcriptional ArsR family regulator
MRLAVRGYFVYGESMDAHESVDTAVAGIAAAIAEPARTRMLYSLLDGHARTGTELAMVAEVAPSTASVHLNRLKTENLVKVQVQGRHRYYSLAGPNVARALERLSVLAGVRRGAFVPGTPEHLRVARSCYDHMAGAVAVSLHDGMIAAGWMEPVGDGDAYQVTARGAKSFAGMGVDLDHVREQRRRFAFGCLDWSERRPHLGGALGAAVLTLALRKRWVEREFDSRALSVTRLGRRELEARFGVTV